MRRQRSKSRGRREGRAGHGVGAQGMAAPSRSGEGALKLEAADLFKLASARIVRRGLSYARAGRVTDLVVDNGRLEARVEGTHSEPYLVMLEHDGEEILSSCTCPFDWEPFCKHAIAALATHSGLVAAPADPEASTKSVADEELEVRRRRGTRSGFRVRRVDGDGFFGLFDVTSPSEKVYRVEIRSLAERVNRCTCRDFAIATLGTCKHIEAVLAALRKRSGKRTFEKAAARPARVAQVLVDYSDVPRIRLRLPQQVTPALRRLSDAYFDAEGFFRGDPVDDMAAFLDSARRIRKAMIYGDVIEHSERIGAERRAVRRREEVSRQVLEAGARIPGLRARLYPYQVEGTAFLASRGRALLGDDMGLGKTVQAIAATHLLRQRREVRRALIVCPASLKHQWAAEIERFTGSDCQVVGGTAHARREQYRSQAPFTIANYELVLRDVQGVADLAPDLLILDEAQRVRNWRTKTAEAIKAVSTPYAFVLTGTPLQNRLDDLYSVMQVVDGRILGPLWAYNESFVIRENGKHKILGYQNLDELRRRLAPVVLRRTKEEVKLQLPERIDSRLGVDLTRRQRDLMEENVAIAARLAKIAEKRPLTPKEEERLFMAMQNARMACNAAGLVDKETKGSPKLDEFEQLLRDLCLDRGRKVLVFSEWEAFGRMAAQRAERLGIGFVRLHGAVPSHKRGDLIARFRDDPKCLVFFSTDAGGLGLNLQFASTMINLELPWNPAVLDQRIGRIHRHGQSERVHVIMLVADQSFEAGLEQTLRSKRDLLCAALDQRSETGEVAAPTSCLRAVRDALLELESEQEPGEAPVLEEEPARESPAAEPVRRQGGAREVERGLPEGVAGERAEQASKAQTMAEVKPQAEAEMNARREAGAEASRARKIAEILGPRLVRVVALQTGRMVALVDRVDPATQTAAEQLDMTAIAAETARALEDLGSDSLFASARVLLERGGDASDTRDVERAAQQSLAERKLAAATTLASAGMGAEALEQAFAAMSAAMRAKAIDAGTVEGVSGLPPVRLLYEVLVPKGLLTLEDAARASKAEGLARAYANATLPAPAQMVRDVLEDARRMLAEASAPGVVLESEFAR